VLQAERASFCLEHTYYRSYVKDKQKMTLRQLIDQYAYQDIRPFIEQAVDHDENDLRDRSVRLKEMEEGFAEMKQLKPTFGFIDTVIDVKMLDGRLIVSNMHLGSTSDLLSRRIAVAPDVKATDREIAALCVYQLVAHQHAWVKYRDEDDVIEN
jgi:hypothetical protein